jgi:hypothetical protein
VCKSAGAPERIEVYRAVVGGGGFAEDEELYKAEYEDGDRELPEEEALRKREASVDKLDVGLEVRTSDVYDDELCGVDVTGVISAMTLRGACYRGIILGVVQFKSGASGQ